MHHFVNSNVEERAEEDCQCNDLEPPNIHHWPFAAPFLRSFVSPDSLSLTGFLYSISTDPLLFVYRLEDGKVRGTPRPSPHGKKGSPADAVLGPGRAFKRTCQLARQVLFTPLVVSLCQRRPQLDHSVCSLSSSLTPPPLSP